MFNPPIWSKLKVPLQWGIFEDHIHLMAVLEARDNQEIELMLDFDNNIWWRRDLTEDRELGL